MKPIFSLVVKISLYLLIFLTPLFWLPFTFEVFEFNKQYLIYSLVAIAFLAWLAKMVFFEKGIHFRKTRLDIPVLTFLLIAIISTIFSVDKNSSIFGFYGRFSNGLILLLVLGIFYFLLTNNLNSEEGKFIFSLEGILNTLLLSTFFVVLITYFSFFGVWQKISSVLPPLMLQKTFNPVSGSTEGLAMFLVVGLVILTNKILFEKKIRALAIYYFLLIASLGLLVIIDSSSAWLTIILSLGVFLILALASRIFKEDINRLLLPIFLILISSTFLFINTSDLQSPIFQLPKEQVLDQKTGWKVAFGVARENLKNLLFGSGIGTFYFDFSKHKPIEFNKNLWWQIRYGRAGNHLAEILGTMGFVGFINYLVLIAIFLLTFWSLQKNSKTIIPATTFLAIFFGQLFYYQNIVLAFLFWLFLGVSVASWQGAFSDKKFSFKDFPEVSLIFSANLMILLFVILIGCYFSAKFYLADLNYLKAQFISSATQRTEVLERAVNLNPKIVVYRTTLAQSLLFQIFEEIRKPLAEQDRTKIQQLMAESVNQAMKATEVSPNYVASWETLAIVYRELQPLVKGANDKAIEAFQKAIELEPKNPILYTEIGKLYLDSDLQKAKENFAKAKELKSDYIDVLIQEALVSEKENNLDEAIKKMEEVVVNYPLNIEAAIEARFQLGRLYFNKDRTEEAISQFENLLYLAPDHLNSLYFLGLIYEKKGEKEKALSYFKNVLELSPANEEVKKKIEELEK